MEPEWLDAFSQKALNCCKPRHSLGIHPFQVLHLMGPGAFSKISLAEPLSVNYFTHLKSSQISWSRPAPCMWVALLLCRDLDKHQGKAGNRGSGRRLLVCIGRSCPPERPAHLFQTLLFKHGRRNCVQNLAPKFTRMWPWASDLGLRTSVWLSLTQD